MPRALSYDDLRFAYYHPDSFGKIFGRIDLGRTAMPPGSRWVEVQRTQCYYKWNFRFDEKHNRKNEY